MISVNKMRKRNMFIITGIQLLNTNWLLSMFCRNGFEFPIALLAANSDAVRD